MKSFFYAFIVSMCIASPLSAADQKTVAILNTGEPNTRVPFTDTTTIAMLIDYARKHCPRLHGLENETKRLYLVESADPRPFAPSPLEDDETCANLHITENTTLALVLVSK